MKKILCLIVALFCFVCLTTGAYSAGMATRTIPLKFIDGDNATVTAFTVVDGTPIYSVPVGISGRENLSFVCNYSSTVAIPLYAQAYDSIGAAWIDIEGSAFLVDTLPITSGSAGRLSRIAGLPALEAIRFKMTADGDNATVAGFNLILE